MAKVVVFESERYEKRQSAKRFLFPAIGILAVAVIAVAVTLLLRSRTTVISGGEDTPYPYTWTVNKNGTATLELDHAASPDYDWRPRSASPEMSVLSGGDRQQNKTSFTLKPEREGRMTVVFVLQRGDDELDRVYELYFLVEAESAKDRLNASPVSVAGKPLQGVIRGGAESEFPYSIRTDEDGDLAITVRMPALAAEPEEAGQGEEVLPDEVTGGGDGVSYTWDGSSSDESAALPLGVIYGDEEITAYFRPGAVSGSVTLRVSEAVTGTCITVTCENGEGGSLQVISHSITTG